MNYPKQLISIEGNIGVGKTSLINILKNLLNDIAEIILEPVEEWNNITDENGNNLLKNFYDDKQRWSYTFQNIAYVTRMDKIINIITTSDKKYIILDRSLEADLNTFAKMLHKEKFINKIEWEAYNKWNNFFNKYFGDKIIHKIIYLRCNPEICYERICKRNRDSEKNMSIDYLNLIHEYHDEWLLNKEDNILIINANNDFINDKNNFDEIYNKIMEILFF